MSLMPSPSYATDAQLAKMTQGGLPSAINEQIMRLRLRQGAQVNPQQAPQMPPPRGKMSAEDMIKDFVTRVRGESEAASRSLVPAGTPLPQQPPPQQPPQPAQASQQAGIAGAYACGGAHVRGFQRGGSPLDAKNPAEETESDKVFKNLFGTLPPPLMAVPGTEMIRRDVLSLPEEKGPPGILPQQERVTPLGASPNDFNPKRPSWLDFMSPTGKQVDPQVSASGSASVSKSNPLLSIGDFAKIKAPKAPDELTATPIDYIDPIAAGKAGIAAEQDMINERQRPYLDLMKETKGDLDESKRKSVFQALLSAGLTAMQAGGPSRDPRSGDLMSAVGMSLDSYVKSMEKDKEYQDKLKDKIAGYKLGAGSIKAQTEDSIRGIYATGASAENVFNQSEAGRADAAKFQSAGLRAAHDSLVYQGEITQRDQDMRVAIAKMEAEFKSKAAAKGIDPDNIMKLLEGAAKAGQDMYAATLANNGFASATGPERDRLLSEAQAQAVGAKAAFFSNADVYLFGKEPNAMGNTELQQYFLSGQSPKPSDTGMGKDGKPDIQYKYPFRPTLTPTGQNMLSKDWFK